MNAADSTRVAAALEKLGYTSSPKAEDADVVVLNTCVVRQSAEDKAVGRLTSLKALKMANPNLVINLMGCLVGVRGATEMKERYPYVDVFSQPSDPHPLIDFLGGESRQQVLERDRQIEDILDADFAYTLPDSRKERTVSALLPVVFGCSHTCAYCVIPLRRGREISRPLHEVLADARSLVAQGVKEIILLGQIIDRYGFDLPEKPPLSSLLREMNNIEGLERIRFLTSHPNWMTDELLETVDSLPKVMPHFELPVQAGDDAVLRNMRRGYSIEQFMRIVEKIRSRFSPISFATDLIVGFPGESDAQFEHSVEALKAMRPDMTHVARYSPRPGTLSARTMADDVPDEEKMRRFRVIEDLQERITGEINQAYLGAKVPVLFEEMNKDRWRGRTPTNKLVFAESARDLRGQVRDAAITWTGPWSMIAVV
ncbi:MAG: MiaB/RimO family radical SAM methylthiotransferase [Anaerolineaceae bacterium]|nr:MiaB/RimO family radical SAM methylthiotransferase [Anaerolineaceae bacterium]